MTKHEYQMTKGAAGFFPVSWVVVKPMTEGVAGLSFVIGDLVLFIPWSLVGHWWVIRHSQSPPHHYQRRIMR
jgi:hypothetical protein